MFKLLVRALTLHLSLCTFSSHYRKCILTPKGYDMGSLQGHKVPSYQTNFNLSVNINTAKPLKYKESNFLFVDYISAGGSGEVYLVEDRETGELKILKRFF